MIPAIYYRSILFEKEELNAATRAFQGQCTNSIVKIPINSLVVARYSVLPFYEDIELDIHNKYSRLLNTFHEYHFVSDLGNYTSVLEELTPRTYSLEETPETGGPFVLKGETNSRRNLWKTHMFAENKQEAIKVASRLMDDSLIGQQKIYVRDYVPLESFFIGLDGVPVAREFRFFVYKRQLISGGYYWSSHVDTIKDMGLEIPKWTEVPLDFLNKVIDRIGDNIPFYAMDIAKTKSGEWIVIELNDGQMAGLSENNPEYFYKQLYHRLSEECGALPR